MGRRCAWLGRIGWLVLLIGCAKSNTPTTEPTTESTGSAPAQPAAPTDAATAPIADAAPVHAVVSIAPGHCIIDPVAERACQAKGSGFAYGPRPFIYCSGVAANTSALAQDHAKQQVNQPCVCNHLQGIQQQRNRCNMVPSTPR